MAIGCGVACSGTERRLPYAWGTCGCERLLNGSVDGVSTIARRATRGARSNQQALTEPEDISGELTMRVIPKNVHIGYIFPRVVPSVLRGGRNPWIACLLFITSTALVSRHPLYGSAVPGVEANPNQIVVPSIMGLGVQWDPYDYYSPSPQDWNTIIQRLDFMHPSFIRDIGGGGSTDMRILAWAQQHNSQVILGTWTPSPLGGTSTPSESAIRSWASTTAQYVKGLNAQYGNVIHYYNFVNEPQNLSISTWATMAHDLQAAFTKAGMGNSVQVVGPDTYGDPGSTSPSSSTWPLLQQDAQQQAVAGIAPGMFDIHWYPGSNSDVTDGRIEPALVSEKQMVLSADPDASSVPFVVSEAGLNQGINQYDQQPAVTTFSYGVMMADYAVQVFNAGWNGISAWDLDDAMHVDNSQSATNPPGPDTLKEWGFWNSQGTAMGDPAAFNIRPWFYTWSLMSRLFPSGTRIIGSSVPTSLSKFRMLTGMRVVNGETIISIELVNDGTSAQSVLVQIPTMTTPVNLTQYSYFQNDMPVDANGFAVPSAEFNQVNLAQGLPIFMPSNGVMFLTNQPVPESSTLSLLLLAGSGIIIRRFSVRVGNN